MPISQRKNSELPRLRPSLEENGKFLPQNKQNKITAKWNFGPIWQKHLLRKSLLLSHDGPSMANFSHEYFHNNLFNDIPSEKMQKLDGNSIFFLELSRKNGHVWTLLWTWIMKKSYDPTKISPFYDPRSQYLLLETHSHHFKIDNPMFDWPWSVFFQVISSIIVSCSGPVTSHQFRSWITSQGSFHVPSNVPNNRLTFEPYFTQCTTEWKNPLVETTQFPLRFEQAPWTWTNHLAHAGVQCCMGLTYRVLRRYFY